MKKYTLLIIGFTLFIPFEIWWLSLPGLMHWQGAIACIAAAIIGVGWGKACAS